MINKNNFTTAIINFPKTASVDNEYPDYGYYQLLKWEDWQLIKDSPFNLMRAVMKLWTQKTKCLLYWSDSNEPIYLKTTEFGTVIAIRPFVAIFDGYVMVSNKEVYLAPVDYPELNIVAKFRHNYDKNDRYDSIYVRPTFKTSVENNRMFRNDKVSKYLDYSKKVVVKEQLELEFRVIDGINGKAEAPQDISGWLKLGSFKTADAWPYEFASEEQSIVTLYNHKKFKTFDHEDRSCSAEKFQHGIWHSSNEKHGDLEQLDLTLPMTLKNASDALREASGSVASLSIRLGGLFLADGTIKKDEIIEMCHEIIDAKYFSDDPELAKPDPFEKVDQSYRLNTKAVAEAGDGFVVAYLRRDGDGTPMMGYNFDSYNQIIPEIPINPETGREYGPDEVSIIASGDAMQFGEEGNELEIVSGKTAGCNYTCEMRRVSSINSSHRIACWSQTDWDENVVGAGIDDLVLAPEKIYYLPIGISKYKG